MAYEASLQDKWVLGNVLSLAEEKAAVKEREKTAERMLLKGMSVADAAEFSNLATERVEEIRAALQKAK